MAKTIFIAEDDDNIRELVRCALESYGYKAGLFATATALLRQLEIALPDLILLDVMMPGIDGISALQQIKSNPRTRDIPVILLTARSSEVDKVTGLDLGADDYITKPFSLLELAARIRATLRKSGKEPAEERILEIGGIKLDLDNHEALQNGVLLKLTLKEFELLKLLMQNPSRVIPRDEMLSSVWGYGYIGETRTLDMHIKTLRGKLSDDAENPRYIRTIRAVGYKFITG